MKTDNQPLTRRIIDTARLVDHGMAAATWGFDAGRDSLILAAEHLEAQVSACRPESSNELLRAVARHYRVEAGEFDDDI